MSYSLFSTWRHWVPGHSSLTSALSGCCLCHSASAAVSVSWAAVQSEYNRMTKQYGTHLISKHLHKPWDDLWITVASAVSCTAHMHSSLPQNDSSARPAPSAKSQPLPSLSHRNTQSPIVTWCQMDALVLHTFYNIEIILGSEDFLKVPADKQN